VADVRDASRLRATVPRVVSYREDARNGLAVGFTGPTVVRLRAAGDVPAVVRSWSRLFAAVDGQWGDRRAGLRPFQPFRSRGLRGRCPSGQRREAVHVA
jgi:hypothetical protein